MQLRNFLQHLESSLCHPNISSCEIQNDQESQFRVCKDREIGPVSSGHFPHGDTIILDSFLWRHGEPMLVGTLSSRRWIDEFSTSTMSSLTGEVLILVGFVARESEVLHDGIGIHRLAVVCNSS